MAWVVIIAVLLGMEFNLARLMARSSDSPAGTASILIAPFVAITLIITASRYGRRSPASLVASFGGALFATIVVAALTSKVMWGSWLGADWPIAFMAVSLVGLVPLALYAQEICAGQASAKPRQ
jgi:hypothetical protein